MPTRVEDQLGSRIARARVCGWTWVAIEPRTSADARQATLDVLGGVGLRAPEGELRAIPREVAERQLVDMLGADLAYHLPAMPGPLARPKWTSVTPTFSGCGVERWRIQTSSLVPQTATRIRRPRSRGWPSVVMQAQAASSGLRGLGPADRRRT